MSDFGDTYNRSAAIYRSVRPDYPAEVVDAIKLYAQPAEPRVLEIGVGTGQATRRLAAQGWNVVGLEPGPDLAAVARLDLARFPNVEIRESTFEAASLPDSSFDLVAAATAWHWVDPEIGYPKAFRVLHDTGTIALWWNAHVPDTRDPRWSPVRAVYERIEPELARLARLTPDRPDYDPAAEIAACSLFVDVETHVFPFTVEYSADAFLALLDTYASHQHLGPRRRAGLDLELRDCIETELDGTVTKPYEAVLVLARPKR